ncbi:MAG: hypothetical protein LBT43_18545 [Prevotella sp.]|jgi:hypothetical protein|nr:hypothetical protein [Prevotella sp.]
MSELLNILVLAPPKVNCGKETKEVSGFICPVCNGKKEFIYQKGHDEWGSEKCTYCNGAGKIKVSVVMHWSPDEE